MRRMLSIALALGAAALPALAAETTRDRVGRYFASWYSFCPKTKITTFPTGEVWLPGYEAYRVERACDLKNRNEMSVTVVDSARDEVFVGEILHSDERKDQPFSPAADVPMLEAALRDIFGVPISIAVRPGSRGPLRPIQVSLTQAPRATATLPGFVSEDGATLMLGEFQPLGVDPAALRERLLAESPGVRPQKGSFYVTAFIDFQCEKCRQRTPEVRDSVRARGGALEIRFLPLVKVHNWSFAAAESAAALANVSPSLYFKYEEAIFPHVADMTDASARQLAADVAEAAGVRDAFSNELSSGRARARVLRDIDLALRLGLNGTPVFYYKGVCLSSEAGLAEDYIASRLAEGTSR